VKISIDGKEGLFDLKPVTMRVFGGQGSGDIRADFSGSVPEYHVHYSLSKFHLAEFFKTLSPRNLGDGPMDFSTNLSMRERQPMRSCDPPTEMLSFTPTISHSK
jgi:hypothetical protein